MAKQHDDIQSMAEVLKGEIQRDAQANARALFGDEPHGTEDMSQQAYIDFVRRNWPDPNFRQALLIRIGATEFLKVAHEVMAPELAQAQAQHLAATGGVP